MKKLFTILAPFIVSTSFAAEYVVHMHKALDASDITQIQKMTGVNSISRFTPMDDEYFNKLYIIDFDNNKVDIDVLKSSMHVKKIEKTFDADFYEIISNPKSEMVTNDMHLPLQWGLYNQEQLIVKQQRRGGTPDSFKGVKGVDIGWKNSIDKIEGNLKKNPVVAVVDTGIDLSHPELVDQIYRNEAECDANGNLFTDRSLDRDNNGYPSDCFGFNFTTAKEFSSNGDLQDSIFLQMPIDDKNHGTHVSGIIAAKRNNQIGVSGVSDKIKILPVKVTGFVDETRDRLKLRAPSYRIAQGILYSVVRGVDVINLSLGWPKSMDTEYMRRAILTALSRNISIVAAAGNNNTNGNIFPCAYQGVICVGSADANGEISDFSNYGGEVDILAPGDQIVSTIPTNFATIKLNTQGYDILSGTSQAAPYVSAAVALLKGVYPEITQDEIQTRLYSGASAKKDNFKSMFGVLNLENTFKDEPTKLIVPQFKSRITYQQEVNPQDNSKIDRFYIDNKSEIYFNRNNGVFTFPLYLKNVALPIEDEKVKIIIQFHTNNIRLQANTFLLSEEDLKRPLGITGQILSKSMDMQVKYSVVIQRVLLDEVAKTEQVISSQEFIHEISLAKMAVNIGSDKNLVGGIEFEIDQTLITDSDASDKIFKEIRSVEDKIIRSDFPAYYIQEQNENENNGIRLYFYSFDGKKYIQNQTSYYSKKATKLLEVTRGDFNYDKKPDYLIKTLVMEDETNGHILYSYRDQDLAPLVGQFSDIKYRPEFVNVTPKTVRYLKTELGNGMTLATPVFISTGPLPDLDQVNDSWTLKDKSLMRRIYYFDLKLAESPEYFARSFMNTNFIKDIRASLQGKDHYLVANNDTNIDIIQLLHQSSEEYYLNQVHAMASYGLNNYQTNFKLEVLKGKYSIQLTDYMKSTVIGYDYHPIIDLSGSKVERAVKNAFIGFLTTDILKIASDYNDMEKVFVYRNRDLNDQVLSFISLFKTADEQFYFMETIDTILLIKEDHQGKRKISKRKTKKFSFLPGNQMSEIYFPIVIKDKKGDFRPAIYVDATQLSSNNIYVNTIIGDDLIAPVDLSIAVPNYCSPKNPADSQVGDARYILICQYNGKVKIFFEQLIAN